MIKLLLKHGARLNDIDEIGFSAFDYAIMGDKHENQAYLKSIGAKLGNPTYPSDATNQPLPISEPASLSGISINGYVNKLAVSSQRPDILAVSVVPYDKLIPDENHGLYLFLVSNPNQPRMLAHFPSIKPRDFALSSDGKTAYVMNMGFNGAPSNQKYGLLVIDITIPTTPHLAEFIQGDFMTMHLSQDDKHLYLQERDLPTSPARGILVFSTEQQKPQLLCSNPFAKTKYDRLPFAYSFATFPDETLVAIRERLGGIYLYDVSNPCDTKMLLQVSDENMGSRIVGHTHRTLISTQDGLISYKLTDAPTKLSSWRGSADHFYINKKLGILVATFGNEVALSTLNAHGNFLPNARYGLEGNIGSVTLTDTGWLYVGINGKLISAKIFSQQPTE